MDRTGRFPSDGSSLISFRNDESLRIPHHLSRYAEEVDRWRREALAARAARAETR